MWIKKENIVANNNLSEKTIENNHEWHRKNRSRLVELQKERRKNNPERAAKIARDSALKANYGITLEDYDKMFKLQKGRCAICGEKYGRTLHVDHNHRTYKVRGLLCQKCNMAIGLMQDNVKMLRKAIEYLEEFS